LPDPPHVTLVFNCPHADVKKYIGRIVHISIEEIVTSETLQVLRVSLDNFSFLQEGRIPHITLSWTDGTSPVESNVLLNDPLIYASSILFHPPIRISGRIQFKPFSS
jgi:hypothetical protein